jgi:Icc-related predicted phosphoesterase
VSDVHGTADALALAGGADMLICLGDLLLFLDYADPGQGIFAELYGAEYTREYIELRTAKRFDEARRLTRQLMARNGAAADPGGSGPGGLRASADGIIRRQYKELFEALPEPAYLTYGNVDVPEMWQEYLKPGHQVIDGGRAEAGGFTFGFAGAGLVSPYRTPNEIPEDAFSAKLEAAVAGGPVDVLCTHVPPAVPELLYDVVARRMETGSTALLEVIRQVQPRYALFGHVHQPLARRFRIGRTECVNVGHFRATRAPFALAL